MKQTLTINLNGTVFHIDDDAYQTLKQYLTDIKQQLAAADDDPDDILADIEARIAELLADMLQVRKREVVDMDMLRIVMHTMGHPGAFAGEETEPNTTPKARKRFYRDTDNALLGGVAAGLAAYIGWDVVIVRILLLIITLFGWPGVIPIYCLMWIIAPAARTAAHKLEMQGQEATIENIKNAVTTARHAPNNPQQTRAARTRRRAARILRALLKALLITCGICAGFTVIIVIAALFLALLAVLFSFGTAIAEHLPLNLYHRLSDLPPWQDTATLIALTLLAAIPLFTLAYTLVRYLRTRRTPSAFYCWSALALWLLALIAFAALTLTRWQSQSGLRLDTNLFDDDNANHTTELRQPPAFHALRATGTINLTLTPDSLHTLTLSGPEHLLQTLTTEVRDSVLHIHTYNRSSARQARVNVTLTAPQLHRIELCGGTLAHTTAPLTQPALTLALYDAGRAHLQLCLDSALTVDLAGASRLQLSGHTPRALFDLVGASRLEAATLRTLRTQLNSSGASHAHIWCEEDLKLRLSGASRLTYKGTPHLSERILSGASSLRAE